LRIYRARLDTPSTSLARSADTGVVIGAAEVLARISSSYVEFSTYAWCTGGLGELLYSANYKFCVGWTCEWW